MQGATRLAGFGQGQDLARGQFLAGFPAGEGVGVVRGQQRQFFVGPVIVDDDGG
ncbi:hypothetical protein D3C87_1758460 [compost metagenome]